MVIQCMLQLHLLITAVFTHTLAGQGKRQHQCWENEPTDVFESLLLLSTFFILSSCQSPRLLKGTLPGLGLTLERIKKSPDLGKNILLLTQQTSL